MKMLSFFSCGKSKKGLAGGFPRFLVRFFTTLSVLMILLSFFSRATAKEGEKRKYAGKLVVIVAERLTIDDLAYPQAENIISFCRHWAVGLMATRNQTPGLKSSEVTGKEYITLSSGKPSLGAPGSYLCLNEKEMESPSSSKRLSRTERVEGVEFSYGSVDCLVWEDVKRKNTRLKGVTPGLLGSVLKEEGITRAAVGNADDIYARIRFAPLIACDKSGRIPTGNITVSAVLFDSNFPGGLRTDTQRTLSTCRSYFEEARFIVVEFGDLARLERHFRQASDERISKLRAQAVSRLDRLAHSIADELDLKTSALFIISPVASAEEGEAGVYLTPIVAVGKGFRNGLLTSSSTKREGLVSNLDFLPSVCEFFKITAPLDAAGSVMRSVDRQRAVKYLLALKKRLVVSLGIKWHLMVALIVFVLILIFLTIFGYYADRRKRFITDTGLRRLFPVLRDLSLVAAATPLTFLLVPAFGIKNQAVLVVVCLSFGVFVGLAASFVARRFKRLDAFSLVCALTALAIVFDLHTGSRLIISPLLGSSALEGFRFYGLTNAVVGLALAATLWAVAGYIEPEPFSFIGKNGENVRADAASRDKALSRKKIILAVIIFAIVCLSIGLGPLGANFGGFLTALFIFSFFVSGKPLISVKRRIFFIVSLICVGTAFILLTDAYFFKSHAGRAVSGQFAGMLSILENKITTQVRQFSYFLLPSFVLLSGIAVLALWMKSGSEMLSAFWRKAKVHTFAFHTLLLGSIVGFALNDTGTSLVGAVMLLSAAGICYYFASYKSMTAESAGTKICAERSG